MLEAKLLVVGGDAKASEIQLRLPTIIGRGREASLTLPHPLVSRRHTEIFEREGRLFVRDLGSLNGTFVNSQRIEEECELAPDQLLTLGNVTFRASYDVDSHCDSDKAIDVTTVPLADGVAPARPLVATESDQDFEAAEAGEQKQLRRTAFVGVAGNAAVAKGDSFSPSCASSEAVSIDVHMEAASLSPQHSIAVSQLESLPAPVADITDDLGLEGGSTASDDAVDPSDFQFDGVDQPVVVDPSQSGLGSFLKKLPL